MLVQVAAQHDHHRCVAAAGNHFDCGVFGRLRLVLSLYHTGLGDGLFEFFAMGVEDQSGFAQFQVDFHREIDVFSQALNKNCALSKATIDH
ncbi:MAG TPA: hypothetical protein PLB25_01375 [Rhodoferax sp.]|nr:hypothetical protein [Rhodoferax sp.]